MGRRTIRPNGVHHRSHRAFNQKGLRSPAIRISGHNNLRYKGDTPLNKNDMNWIKKLFQTIDPWEYGTCFANDQKPQIARRHKKKGNVEFILWKAGERGNTEDFWIDFHSDHWRNFKFDRL